ncbi:unnamed protein product [Chondrus crispus]|uniref:DUF659 domain-containing protein n=1 Tax=Chondrus crispus TaxID=2769 RepID=R7QFS0_CHOCR|nr:unnamed protein product [Chondrus crispus]CDF36301.1 unnamed protein product [Chondrus crispus]|eukprot:XP_005716120.1 unnamed protein product [Chondrus crispus]
MPISFSVIQPIVSLIGDLFVDTIHEKTTKERAISGFTTQTHPGINDYCVKIANLTLFDATIAFISNGATPRVATALVSEMFRATSTTVPPTRLVSDLSEARLAAYMRCVIAYNLQTLADVLRQKWTFSLSFAEVKHETNHYIDVGVRFCLGDDLHAFHILCCPLPNRFNKDEIVRSIYAVLDALHPSWKKSIIAVSTDGAEAAEVAAQELLVHLRPESSGALMHTWSGAHQLDLLVSSTIRTVLDESYFSSLNNLITFLHSQDSFMAETKSPCPKATVSSWLSIWAALEWLKLYRIRIVEVLEEKKTGFEPSAPWWILSMGLLEFVRAVAKTYNRIQGFTRLLSKQVSLLSELLRTLKRLSGCKGPITRDELGLLSQWDLITDGNYVVRKTTVQSFLTGLGSFVYVSANELPQSTVDGVVHAVSTLFLSSIVGLASIVESRKEPSAGADELCPVLPNELVKLSRTDFNRVLRSHADRLSPKMSCEDLDRTEEEFGRLTEACYREDVFNSSVQNVKSYSTFANAWGMLRGRFPLLYEFCGGIGSGYPGSFSKSVNFSVKGGHTELFRIRGMTDFPLEGSLHCQQYQKLKGLTMSCTPNEVAISSHLCR